MTDELQALEDQSEAAEVDENTEGQTAEDQSDGDPGSAPAEDKVVFDDRQQAKVNDLIGQKVKATRTVERELVETRRRLDEAEAKVPQEERPTIPDLPDPYDDGFEDKLREREEAVQKRAEFDANRKAQDADTERQNQRVFEQQRAHLAEVTTTYSGRAKALGITGEELQAAGNTLREQGISNDLTLHILQDDKGPAITKFLADNPLALDEMRSMSAMQAAIHIETTIKPKVGVKETTSAPSPADTLDGGGSPPTERGPKGAKFE